MLKLFGLCDWLLFVMWVDVIDDVVGVLYCDCVKVVKIFVLSFVGWIVGIVEVWFVLYFFGYLVSWFDVLLLESVG